MDLKSLTAQLAPSNLPPRPYDKHLFARVTSSCVLHPQRWGVGEKHAGEWRFDDNDIRQFLLRKGRIGTEAVLHFMGADSEKHIAFAIDKGWLPRPETVDGNGYWLWQNVGAVLSCCACIKAPDGHASRSEDFQDCGGWDEWSVPGFDEMQAWTLAALDRVREAKRAGRSDWQRRKEREQKKAAEMRSEMDALAAADAKHTREAAEFAVLDALARPTRAQVARHAELAPIHCPRYRAAQRARRDAVRAAERAETQARANATAAKQAAYEAWRAAYENLPGPGQPHSEREQALAECTTLEKAWLALPR
jgi:hypothetical protein